MRERFIDEVKIFVKGGDGGNGCTSFRREKFVEHGGPDGGAGGKGGDVILKVDPSVTDLVQFKFKAHFKAGKGTHGQGSRKDGKSAEPVILAVPQGTIVIDPETGKAIGDLVLPGQEFIAARGGRGGRGNAGFATSVRQVPRFSEKGEPGEERWLKLSLKILADVGLVGLPNAGKSSLLSVITGAEPAVASYPFTTMMPVLGVLKTDGDDIVISDLPGIISGAHEGKGLGFVFLKHIQRSRAILYMMDISEDGHNILKDGLAERLFNRYLDLRQELDLYDSDIIKRPFAVVINKVDLLQDEGVVSEVKNYFDSKHVRTVFISCIAKRGLEDLKSVVEELVNHAPVVDSVPVFEDVRPSITDFKAKRVNDYYVVEGYQLERFMAMMDMDNPDAVSFMQKRLKGIGVEDALLKLGAKEGDIVVIGNNEFDFTL